MLQTQRFLAFASRIQTYVLSLLIFVFLCYAMCGYANAQGAFVSLLLILQRILTLTMFFMTCFLLVLAIVSWVENRICPASQLIATVIRTLLTFGISFLFALIEHVVNQGVVIGGV